MRRAPRNERTTMKCSEKNCNNNELGFTVLKDGGSTHVRECTDHLKDHHKDRLVLPEPTKTVADKAK
jgi:hypothetical protein